MLIPGSSGLAPFCYNTIVSLQDRLDEDWYIVRDIVCGKNPVWETHI
jgi:hypothetical protein